MPTKNAKTRPITADIPNTIIYTFFLSQDKLTSTQEDANGNSTEYQTSIFQDSGDDEAGR